MRLKKSFTCTAFALLFTVASSNGICQDNQNQEKPDSDPPQPFEMSKEVAAILNPLFDQIRKAKVSRATIDLTAETVVDGAIIDQQTSSYQIASKSPDQFTIYLKEPERGTRIYNNGKMTTIAFSPKAYVELAESMKNQDAVFALPIALGPYPEPPLALSLAGVDPELTMATGMKSIVITGKTKFRGKTPAVHFTGVQDDDVQWDLWITQEKSAKPLRLIVDLTPMLRANGQLDMPPGYKYQLRFDFQSWRVSGTVDEKMFSHSPPKGAKKYESIDEYADEQAEIASQYFLLGKAAPTFMSKTAQGNDVHTGKLKGKILVLDFWATYSEPSLDTIPIMNDVCKKYRDKGVEYLPINIGEQPEAIKSFLKKHSLKIDTVLDSHTKITKGYQIQAIPMYVLIGKDGLVQAAQMGPEPESLANQLSQQLDALVAGKRLAPKD